MDPMMAMGIGATSGLVALLAGALAISIWIRKRRIAWLSGGISAAAAAVAFGCMVAMPPGYQPAEQERVERLHAQFAPALEQYRRQHGAYPPTLEAAGIQTPQTRYGPLRYQASRTGEAYYEISFGNYTENGFTSFFNSRHGKWQLDT
jgi:type II secretory pathway pseudopilin PulG